MRISVLSFSVPVALCAMTPVRASSQSAPAVRSNDPLVHSHVRATLPDSTFWPEGVDADPRTGSLYVASVRHRTIAEVDATGKTRELIPRDQETLGAILGVRVDTARNVLWATTSGYHQVPGYVAADSAVAALLEISITDGRIVERWDTSVAPGGRVLGDLAVGPRGDVFLTDSNHPVLFWLHGGKGQLDSITSTEFSALQGMAPSPDGRSLYVADYSRGFFRLDLVTRALTHVEDPPGASTRGCDGIVWFRDGIIAVQNGSSPPRIVRFWLTQGGDRFTSATVIDQNSAIADEPTIGTLLGGEFVYVANSQWDKHDALGKRISAKALAPPILLAVPLP